MKDYTIIKAIDNYVIGQEIQLNDKEAEKLLKDGKIQLTPIAKAKA